MDHEQEDLSAASTVGGLPVAPALAPTLERARLPAEEKAVDARVLLVAAVAAGVGAAAALAAQVLTHLIGLVTHLAYYGRADASLVSPAGHRLGGWAVLVPVAGGLVVGLMARYGSKAIRGHGIPEAMEQVLTNQSRIPARMTFLKPLSAAVAIGTGGPFGAEGPIIATGGAFGSLVGQLLHATAVERKTLLAAGAAAGMAATFGTPVSAVLLAVELLLFEFHGRSLVPVALGAAVGAGVRVAFAGAAPVFALPAVAQPTGDALAAYVGIGALVGLLSVGVTRAVYAVEDAFERLPMHWMWWPALGALAVGAVGLLEPRTLGVGYDNIDRVLGGGLAAQAILVFVGLKFASWAVALGSGTSGGTLAPLFTIGGGLGAALGVACAQVFPALGVDPRLAALVGMAAMFAGASRALLTSAVFAFETTRQPVGLLPLLGGCTAAYLVSTLLMKNSIMTERIVRRGVRVVSHYTADFLEQVPVGEVASSPVAVLGADEAVGDVAGRILEHQGFPVVDAQGDLVGVVTRRDLIAAPGPEVRVGALLRRPVAVAFADSSLREAADHMVREGVGRLPVVSRAAPRRVIGFITRSDLLAAHGRRIEEGSRKHRALDLRRLVRRAGAGSGASRARIGR